MATEVHYTSAPRGVFPGTQGYSTVACSAQMPRALVERMEGLSAYRNVFPPHDPKAKLNPVAFNHLRVPTAAGPRHVLSRIGDAGLDYSDRTNKYAHHVILDDSELARGGPAWLMSRPGVLNADWDGHVGFLPESRPVPQGDRPARVCDRWARATGDAGWAGVLAEAFLADPRRVAVVVFDPGTDVLALFEEALALLPANRRWDVSFSTYFTGLQQGVACSWRGVVRGSPEAAQALGMKNALILDLGQPLGRAEGGSLVALARTGTAATPPPLSTFEPVEAEFTPFPDYPAEPSQGWRPPTPTGGTYDMAGSSHTPTGPVPPPLIMEDEEEEEPKRRRWLLPTLGVAALLIVLGLTGAMLLQKPATPARPKAIANDTSEAAKEQTKSVAKNDSPPTNKVQETAKTVPSKKQEVAEEKPKQAPEKEASAVAPTVVSKPETSTTEEHLNTAIKTSEMPLKPVEPTQAPVAQLPESKPQSEAPFVRSNVMLPRQVAKGNTTQLVLFNDQESNVDYKVSLKGLERPNIKAIHLKTEPLTNSKPGIAIVVANDKPQQQLATIAISNSGVEFGWEASGLGPNDDRIRAIRSCIAVIEPQNQSEKHGRRFHIALRESISINELKITTQQINIPCSISDKLWGDQGIPFGSPIRIIECSCLSKKVTPSPISSSNDTRFDVTGFTNNQLRIGFLDSSFNISSLPTQSVILSISPSLNDCFTAATNSFNQVSKQCAGKIPIKLDEQNYAAAEQLLKLFSTHLHQTWLSNQNPFINKNTSSKFSSQLSDLKRAIISYSNIETEIIRRLGESDRDGRAEQSQDVLKQIISTISTAKANINTLESTLDFLSKIKNIEAFFRVTLGIDVEGETIEVAKIGYTPTNSVAPKAKANAAGGEK